MGGRACPTLFLLSPPHEFVQLPLEVRCFSLFDVAPPSCVRPVHFSPVLSESLSGALDVNHSGRVFFSLWVQHFQLGVQTYPPPPFGTSLSPHRGPVFTHLLLFLSCYWIVHTLKEAMRPFQAGTFPPVFLHWTPTPAYKVCHALHGCPFLSLFFRVFPFSREDVLPQNPFPLNLLSSEFSVPGRLSGYIGFLSTEIPPLSRPTVLLSQNLLAPFHRMLPFSFFSFGTWVWRCTSILLEL